MSIFLSPFAHFFCFFSGQAGRVARYAMLGRVTLYFHCRVLILTPKVKKRALYRNSCVFTNRVINLCHTHVFGRWWSKKKLGYVNMCLHHGMTFSTFIFPISVSLSRSPLTTLFFCVGNQRIVKFSHKKIVNEFL